MDDTHFDALVELMRFYDAVCPDVHKAVVYTTKVKTIALQALDEARAVPPTELRIPTLMPNEKP